MPSDYLDPIRAELTRAWPDNRTVNLIFHGHSVPAGYFDTPDVRTDLAYPRLVQDGLKRRYPYAVINAIVTAIGGEHSAQGADRFDAVVAHRPDVLFLDYALNDRSIGLEQAETAWTSMISAAVAAGTKVVLLTPTGDLRSDLTDPADDLNRHADQVRNLAERHGLPVADSTAAFLAATAAGTDPADLMSHVNHPNEQGHSLVAEAILRLF
ncbi:SGNH/GDSL hydrolase family protein [Microlunatus speluncae]|uniref:SGNH/GDSL hydrolase family protein n=1 Tax=Microlunatus speluncae TaxID=2594267 RepID=UPI0012665D2E|nr:SGNH/GDSL hydrolase family protein [Microlunatus speluncae]